MRRSSPAEARTEPSGENATTRTTPLWPRSVANSPRCVGQSQAAATASTVVPPMPRANPRLWMRVLTARLRSEVGGDRLAAGPRPHRHPQGGADGVLDDADG